MYHSKFSNLHEKYFLNVTKFNYFEGIRGGDRNLALIPRRKGIRRRQRNEVVIFISILSFPMNLKLNY